MAFGLLYDDSVKQVIKNDLDTSGMIYSACLMVD